MKKTYIKPETQTVVVEISEMIALSTVDGNATNGEVLSRDSGRFWDDGENDDDY